jgi:CheY-like chemotaxis protein
MSLVLAIQPDPDQAARLLSVCRRIGAEVVLASSASDALATLGDRVPDVILSAPLLPVSDDAAIADRLRSLGEDALHVQALSAPLLGEPLLEPQPRGLFKAFTRQRRPAGPAVCDPLVFAGELSGHLLRAVAERAALTGVPIEAPSLDDLRSMDVVSGFSRTPNDRPLVRSRREPPVDIDLTSLLDGIAERGSQARKTTSRRRRRRIYDDAAYFDPARCRFAAVLEKFDEFARQAR